VVRQWVIGKVLVGYVNDGKRVADREVAGRLSN